MVSQVRNSQILARAEEPLSSAARNQVADETIVSGNASYRLQCITNISELSDLKNDWNRLHEQYEKPFSYFQGFDWCFGWAKNFCENGENRLSVYVLRTHDAAKKPVLIWPMAKVRSRAMVDVLVCLSDPLGQYSGFLHDDAHVDEALASDVFSRIRQSSDCDAISVMNCPETSLLASITRAHGYLEQIQPISSILDLDQITDWETYHVSLPKNQRKDRNKRRNKLQSLGELKYEVVAAGTPRYRELISTCLAFKQVWLRETGRRSGLLGDAETARFFAELTSEVRGEQIISGAVMHCMSVNGAPVGLEMGMICKGDYYSYLGAIDWEWRSFSPGKVQMEFAQRWAKDAGLKRFDFLSDPSGYKAYWTNSSQQLVSLNIPITLKGQFYCRVWKAHMKPKLKQFYHKTGAANRVLFNKAFAMLGSKKPDTSA